MEIIKMSKAKLNSVYGMTAQNPAKPEVYFDGEWDAWCVWTTVWARYLLQCSIDLLGTRFVYCDTDSFKYRV